MEIEKYALGILRDRDPFFIVSIFGSRYAQNSNSCSRGISHHITYIEELEAKFNRFLGLKQRGEGLERNQ